MKFPRRAGRGAAGALGVAVATLCASLAFAPPAAAGKLKTGFADPLFGAANAGVRDTWLQNAKRAKSKVVRIDVSWRTVAPPVEPADPTNPAVYDWGSLPAAVAEADARGLRVLLTVSGAPTWAEGPNRPASAPAGTWKPRAWKFGKFGQALAAKFKGHVRHYQAWNEPNLFTFLTPQYEGRRSVAPNAYKRLLNSFYLGVHKAQGNAFVVSAGTAPFGEPRGGNRTRPLAFMRKMMCLKNRKKLKPTKCKRKARFDALAHHPISTSGGPGRSAHHPDDVVVPDVKHVRRTLRKAERRNRVRGRNRHQVWLTEFWWETRPPDRCKGVPLRRHKRWISRALRSFQRQGASVAINYLIRDEPHQGCGRGDGKSFDTGVFFDNGKRKPAFRAFKRFGR